ncbi:MAG: sulfatase-like hydrolase/transferase, partial [Legionella sp.]|nr:sulfatase-like hydrolase/transferase [Legionella sp.]
GGLALYSIILSVYLSTEKPRLETELVTKNVSDASIKKLPNVYFIWLDAMETGYMKKYILDNDADNDFPGFTFFENNSANYLYTDQSYASFMSGTVFEGGSYNDWSLRGDNLRKDLGDVGYRTTSYAKKNFISSFDDISYSSEKTYLKWTRSNHPFVADFVTYWVVRTLPTFFANQSLEIGSVLGGRVHTWFNSSSNYSDIKRISDGIEPLTGVFTLKQLIADENHRGDNNEFVIAQAVIPHGPHVIDKKCNYRGPEGNTSNAYYEQVECSSNLVNEFLEKLKLLNRYDSSLIIIMGDHGAGWAGQVEGKKDGQEPLNDKYMPWSKSQVISRASALLMVKPPQTSSNKKLSFSHKESQLVDIYPTVLSLLGLDEKIPPGIHGVNLYSDTKPVRKKVITYFKPSKIINSYDADIYELKFSSLGGLNDIVYLSKFIEDDNFPVIVCNQTILFSNFDNYRSEGLSGIEKWGRWSDRKEPSIKFNLNTSRCSQNRLKLNLKGFLTNKNMSQQADVLLNGTHIGEVAMNLGEKNPREFVFSVPLELIKQGEVNKLEFRIENPVTPKSVGVNNDTRLLGFGFESMVFQ